MSPALIPVDEAMDRLLALVRPLDHETVAIGGAAGRWLASPAVAGRDQPPFDSSAMDGYAVAGNPEAGAILRVIGESGAGHAFAGRIGPGEAARIFTGAPVPAGADRVIIQENTETLDSGDIRILVTSEGSNIRNRGEDFAAGTTLAPRRLRAADLTLLAAMNLPRVTVARRPVVALIATGDELVMPGEEPRDDQIIASNGFALRAMAEAEGAEVRMLPIARDTPQALRAVFGLAEGADVVVTIGGASVGDHDLVGPIARELGIDLAFWKIAIRPGKPLMAGAMPDGGVMLGLPGNPVSAIVCARVFLVPLLRALQGDPAPRPQPRLARLGADLPGNGPRSHYMRARLSPDGATVTPFSRQDSALITILSEADALIIRPAGAHALAAGADVPYLPL